MENLRCISARLKRTREALGFSQARWCRLVGITPSAWNNYERGANRISGAVLELVGIEGGVVSGVINLESSGVEASDWRPRHDEQYHEA
jgi:transcriptional regulator with XRE-family HTH domain